jgi:O-antigen/teichoic acid export membrane protein
MLAVHVMSTTDSLMLAWLVGPESVGTYSAANAISSHSVTLVMMVVNLAAYPHALRAYETGGIPGAEKQLQINLNLMLVVAVPVTGLLITLSGDIAHVVLGASFRAESARLIPIIAAAALVAGLRSYVFDLAFQISKRTHGQAMILGLTAAINAVLNLILIPIYAATGAALATLISLLVALAMSTWFGKKHLRIRANTRECLRVIFGVCLGCATTTLIEISPGLANLTLKAVAATIAYSLLIYLTDVAQLRTKLHTILSRRLRR